MLLFINFCTCHWLIPWLLPFILGLALGWLLWGKLRSRIEELEASTRKLVSEKKALGTELEAAEANAATHKSEMSLLSGRLREKDLEARELSDTVTRQQGLLAAATTAGAASITGTSSSEDDTFVNDAQRMTSADDDASHADSMVDVDTSADASDSEVIYEEVEAELDPSLKDHQGAIEGTSEADTLDITADDDVDLTTDSDADSGADLGENQEPDLDVYDGVDRATESLGIANMEASADASLPDVEFEEVGGSESHEVADAQADVEGGATMDETLPPVEFEEVVDADASEGSLDEEVIMDSGVVNRKAYSDELGDEISDDTSGAAMGGGDLDSDATLDSVTGDAQAAGDDLQDAMEGQADNYAVGADSYGEDAGEDVGEDAREDAGEDVGEDVEEDSGGDDAGVGTGRSLFGQEAGATLDDVVDAGGSVDANASLSADAQDASGVIDTSTGIGNQDSGVGGVSSDADASTGVGGSAVAALGAMATGGRKDKPDLYAVLKPDNLQIVEGIGPKMNEVLNQAGVMNWSDLAGQSTADLRRILDSVNHKRYRIIDPSPWPKQAKLALDGDWDDLIKVQKNLSSGRKAGATGETDSKVEKLLIKLGVLKKWKQNDLTAIEGVGPKISGLLKDAGIDTWRELANSDVDRLHKILDAAGKRYKLADPTTWPKQAEMAADGRWDDLKEYQDFLQGGK